MTFQMRVLILAGLASGLLVAGSNLGQAQSQPAPRLNYVFPMGGQVGATLEIGVTGLDMEYPETLHFSFPGVKVEPVGSEKFNPVVEPKKKGGGGIAKGGGQLTQKFKVTLPANAPLGIHDVRIVTKGGISNPRAFVVGDLKEVDEKEPNDNTDKAQRLELNTTVNGLVATGTDVDYYVFAGKKGQRIIVSCLASSIDSRLPAVLELFNSQGNRLASNKDYQANDALLDATLPEDGDFFIRLFSFTYTQGGPEYFYRLTVSNTPWIDTVFPHVVEPGKDSKVTVYGRNLPGGVVDPQAIDDQSQLEKITLALKAPGDPLALQRLAFPGFVPPIAGTLDGFEYRLKSPAGSSNGFLVNYAKAPVVISQNDNLSFEKAQQVQLPCEIAGKIDRKKAQYYFKFNAKKGDVWSIEAFGDRLGAPLDLIYRIVNEKNEFVTEQDENPETTVGSFYTKSDDPARYRFVVPADGTHALMVTSRYAFQQAGTRHRFTVRITPEEPDFRLVAMPASPLNPESVVLGQGGAQAFNILVFRQGNFTGDVTLTGQNLPAGITVAPQVVGGAQKQSALVVNAAMGAAPYAGPIQIVGTASVGDKKLVREVRAATITWPIPQATTPTLTRLDRELVLAVRDQAQFALFVDKDKIGVPQGDKIQIPIRIKYLAPDFKLPVNVIALNPPPGMAQQTPLTLEPGKNQGILQLDSKNNVLAGNFNLVIRGQTQPVNVKQPVKNPGPNFVQSAPPVNLTIVPKALAKVSNIGAVKIQAGKSTEITVRVARLNEYGGPFKVELVAAKGFTAKEATIAAGSDDTKLVIVAEGAQPNTNPILTIRVTALFNEIPIVHEGKVNVGVIK